MPRHVLWWYRADHHHRFPVLVLLRGSPRALRAGFFPVYESGALGGLHPPRALLHPHSGELSADFDNKQDFVGTCIGEALQCLLEANLRRSIGSSGPITHRIRTFYAVFEQRWRLPMHILGFVVAVAETARPWTTAHHALVTGALELRSSRTRTGAMLPGTRTRVAGRLHGYNQVPLQGRELRVQGSDNPRKIDARRTSRRWMRMGELNPVVGVRLQRNNHCRHLRHRCR